jgi:hypothetical protein
VFPAPAHTSPLLARTPLLPSRDRQGAQRARLLAATQKGNPREALGGELDTATVLRDSAKAQRARLLAATQKGNPREALGGELDTATVLRDSAKAQRARLLAATQKGNPREALGRELDTATVLRDSLEAQRARLRAANEERNLPALSAGRWIPCPFCACSSKVVARPNELQPGNRF